MEMINKWQERNAKLTEEINSPWAQQEYLKAELKFQSYHLEKAKEKFKGNCCYWEDKI